MEKLLFSFITAMFLVVPAVCGANSFRLENGQLLQNGMTIEQVAKITEMTLATVEELNN